MAATVAQDRDRIDRAIHHASWLGAFAMFAYGAALSFDVLHTIASAAGLSPVLAWLWPLGFETFMAAAAVAVLAEQRTRPGRTPWYPWVLTALAAGSSIALNFGHPYIPLDPPPRLLVALVYVVPTITAPFAWHLFLLRLAHRRHQDGGQHTRHAGQDTAVLADRQNRPEQTAAAAAAAPASNGQDGQDREPARALVRVLLASEQKDRPLSWQDVADRTGLSRSRAYALLREERARLAASNGLPAQPRPYRRRALTTRRSAGRSTRCGFACASLSPAPGFACADPAVVSVACGWSVTGWLAPAPMIPPTNCARSAAAGPASCAAPDSASPAPPPPPPPGGGDPDGRPSPARRPGSGPASPRLAAGAARASAGVGGGAAAPRARGRGRPRPGPAPPGDLQRLAHLLAYAAELHHDQDAAPPGLAGSSTAMPTHP